MADSDANKAAIEYWDRVAASAKRRADKTVERNRERNAEISLER